eukprot:3399301-Pleurochrysis_carterae.AAC.1
MCMCACERKRLYVCVRERKKASAKPANLGDRRRRCAGGGTISKNRAQRRNVALRPEKSREKSLARGKALRHCTRRRQREERERARERERKCRGKTSRSIDQRGSQCVRACTNACTSAFVCAFVCA